MIGLESASLKRIWVSILIEELSLFRLLLALFYSSPPVIPPL
jgi:hypothetical protein